MNNVIILDENDKSYKRLFFSFANGTLKIEGYKYINNKKYKLNDNDLTDLKELFFPSNLTYVEEKDGYKTFIDNNNLKHFTKDDKEDFIKFLAENDMGAYQFSGKDINSFSSTQSYKIKKDKKTIFVKVASVALFISMLTFAGANLAKNNDRIYEDNSYYEIVETTTNVDYTSDNIVNYTELNQVEETTLDNTITEATHEQNTIEETPIYESDGLNAEDLLYLIENSNLDDGFKEYLSSESLFKDVVDYYNGTTMELLVQDRLNGLRVQYFSEPDDGQSVLLGYYDSLEENVIYLNSGYSYDLCLGHEFVHLLQNPNCTYKFFEETTADLIATEYFNERFNSYNNQAYLLKIIINTIGPECVWNYTFSGDFSEIDRILRDNLSYDDYSDLIRLFDEADFSDSYNQEMETILFKLYENIYGSSILDNENIYYEGKLIDKTYFNEDKMPDKEYNSYSGEYIDNIKTMFPNQSIRRTNNNYNKSY